jgi:Relaxase/Mobilisation nuclease domain
MVAKIKITSSLSRSLNYNEQKVARHEAQCIHAVNYPKDLEHLNFYNKLRRMEHQAAFNERVKANSVHISLNFDEADMLTQDRLKEIAGSYMQQIGFGDQPYLLYEHKDAGHQHIHIVSTNIRADGSRINMHNIGRNQSEKARKNIEQEFRLVKAEGQHKRHKQKVNQAFIQKVQYGKAQTKQAIANVLELVVNQYKFTSLPELNAVLKQYNVMADQGKEDSRLYKYRGLYYRALDENGNKIGVPIKASAFYNKPTLANLEKKFDRNDELRQPHKQRLKTQIDWALHGGNTSLPELKRDLEKEDIATIIRQNKQGKIYGITFVDYETKCVFNGSDLGKEYSAKRILERCGLTEERIETIRREHRQQDKQPSSRTDSEPNSLDSRQGQVPLKEKSLLEILMQPELLQEDAPYELSLRRKRSRRR